MYKTRWDPVCSPRQCPRALVLPANLGEKDDWRKAGKLPRERNSRWPSEVPKSAPGLAPRSPSSFRHGCCAPLEIDLSVCLPAGTFLLAETREAKRNRYRFLGGPQNVSDRQSRQQVFQSARRAAASADLCGAGRPHAVSYV